MINNLIFKYPNIILIITITMMSFIFALPTKANAAPFDQAPVPTYSPVTSTDTVTTATVPANLVSQWRRIYNRPAVSLLTNNQRIPGATIKQYIIARLTDKELKVPMRTYKFDPSAVYAWTKSIADSVNTQASEPDIKIENGRVTKFTPPQTGKSLDRYASTLKIIEALGQGNSTIDLTVSTTQPSTSLGSLNKLGIKELIGRGESKFNGSPNNRRHNIKVGISKMKGVIIKPGEEFSFNKYLGSVEAADGYLPELVIKGDKGTIPELGGGLCQVSSTTFRAAMHAGLPITQRRNHAYAVQYYAPQGSDATIYPGVVDLKFTNDTGNSILIWPYLKDENYLIFDFYGTYDGRKVELGTPYSYDKKASGAMKSTWKRTVTKNGVPKNDVFNSVYQSPALFHKQEQFVPATPPPGTIPAGVTPFVGVPPDTDTNTNSNSN